MKKLLPLFSIAIVMAACNQSPQKDSALSSIAPVQQQVEIAIDDTAGLTSFRNWKVQNELGDISDYQAMQSSAAPVQKQAAKKKTVAPVRKTTKQTSVPAQTTSTTPTSSDNSNVGKSEGGSMSTESGETAKAEKKEGWSKAAKGAVIGGVAGAAGGAVLNKKNRVLGAVIGGVIGAGGGYTIGRGMDKKDGRIEIQ